MSFFMWTTIKKGMNTELFDFKLDNLKATSFGRTIANSSASLDTWIDEVGI